MGSGWTVAELSGETRCQEGTGLGAPTAVVAHAGRAAPSRSATSPAMLPSAHPLQGQIPGATTGVQLPAPVGLPCAWPCSEFGVPATGTYRLMSQDFLTPSGAHNSEDRLLRRHPNPLVIVLCFGG